MNKSSLLLACAAVVALSVTDARADVAPMCSQFDTVTSCAATQLDQPCSGGGVCKAVACEDAGAKTIHKCVTCPTVANDTAGVCKGPSDLGKACGTSGQCGVVPPWCTGNKFSCLEASGGAGGAAGAGGTTAAGGTTSAGGTTAAGGTTSAGGTTAAGGTTTAGGTTAAGGTASTGGGAGSDDSGGCSTAVTRTSFGVGALAALALGLLVARRRR